VLLLLRLVLVLVLVLLLPTSCLPDQVTTPTAARGRTTLRAAHPGPPPGRC
jgi:hypothetical protein